MCLLQALKCHAACAPTEQSKSSGSRYTCRIIKHYTLGVVSGCNPLATPVKPQAPMVTT